jgi:hypothetical protein
MKPRKNMQSHLREASDARMTGVGGDFLDERTNDERGYVPSPRIEPFHLNEGNYISRQTRDYEQKRERIAKSSR